MKTPQLALVLVFLVSLGLMFWPTIYRYEKIVIGENELPVRINRMTGSAAYFYEGWQEHVDEILPKTRDLTTPELKLLGGNAGLRGDVFSGELYNGTEMIVTSVVIRIIAKKFDGSWKWNRRHRARVRLPPLTISDFSIKVMGDGVATHSWNLFSAKGIEPEGYNALGPNHFDFSVIPELDPLYVDQLNKRARALTDSGGLERSSRRSAP